MYNDKTKRQVLVSELEQLKDKYSQMEQTFTELKKQAALHETQGLVQSQEQQVYSNQEQEEYGQGQTS